MCPPSGGAAPVEQDAEAWLRKASLARTAATRAKYATRGLSGEGVDETTRVLLLRQLYLAHLERRRFPEARAIAEEMVRLGPMADVARQDAARACLALGDVPAAVDHLRLAARVAPASRRAFHAWTLGSVLYLAGRNREAGAAFTRAGRWGTTDRPLYAAQAALVALAQGEPRPDLEERLADLEDAPCGQGYGQFVRGELCVALGRRDDARRLLQAFVDRTTSGRVALAVALSGEIARAQAHLQRLEATAGEDSPRGQA